MTKSQEQSAEDALPEGVARGRSLNTPSDELRQRAGGLGPTGEPGPDPRAQEVEHNSAFDHRPDGDLPQGPISGDPRTPVPTTAKDDDVDDLNQG